MSSNTIKKTRRYYLDWLRVIAIFGLIMVHVSAMFDPYPITAVKGRPSFVLILFSTFLHEWRLAILFIVSGAGSYFALGSLTARQFIVARFKRIVIPLIAGTLIVVPIHLYYFQFYRNPGYPKSYFEFYRTIIWRFLHDGVFGATRESLHWAHLWFLAYLFVSALVALPLFIYLRGQGRPQLSKLANVLEKPGAIFLLALPIVLIETTLRAKFIGRSLIIIDDMDSFCLYLVLFIYGFIIISEERIRVVIERNRKVALILGLTTSLVYLLITFSSYLPVRGYNLRWTMFMVLRAVNIWFWCVAVIGYGSKYLNFNHKALPYANQAVYPVYIIHLPIATAIAYRVVQWNIGWPAQFVLIVVGTLAVSLLLYEFIIRRTKVTRYLFGLKVLPSSRPAPQRAPAEVIQKADVPEVSSQATS